MELQQLIEMHGKKIYGLCLRITGNQTDADDLYQETFLRTMKIINRKDFQENPFPFIVKCCLWQAKSNQIKFVRRTKIADVKCIEAEGASETNLELEAERQEVYEMIRNVVSNLPEKYKIPIILFYNAEMSLEEISKSMNLPIGTVKNRLFRAKRMLKNALKEVSL